MTDSRDDRKLIADVLKHDPSATPGPWVSSSRFVGSVPAGKVVAKVEPWSDKVDYADADAIAAYRTAAPELARRLEQRNNLLWRTMNSLPPRPLCRDCADHDGTCQSEGREPCDPIAALPVHVDDLRKERDEAERKLRALLDALDYAEDCGRGDIVDGIRAAYARNLERSKP